MIREIKVRIYTDGDEGPVEATFIPEEGETLPDLLRNLADQYEQDKKHASI